MAAAGSIIRLFVSSTFVDFSAERTLLQQDIFPALRDLCRQESFRFQPIDLRWGVSQEAGKLGRTLSICFEELRRCQELSPDFNLLILLGDRYGWRPLPESIPAAHYARLAPLLAPPMQSLLEQIYAEDRNARPPEYVLRPRNRERRSWETEVAEPLRAALAEASERAGFTAEEALPYVASATHQEIWRGLLAAGCDPSVTVCALRTFTTPPAGPEAGTCVEAMPDAQMRLAALEGSIRARLGDERILTYAAGWQGEEPELDLEALRGLLYALLERRLREVIAQRQSGSGRDRAMRWPRPTRGLPTSGRRISWVAQKRWRPSHASWPSQADIRWCSRALRG